MKFTKAFLVGPRKFELRQIEETIKDDEVMIKISVCGLCNWELNFWFGHLDWGYPQELGHEYAGTVVEVGSRVGNLKVGDKVTALHGLGGFAEYKAVPADRCFKLNDEIDPMYALGEPLKCIVTVLRGAAPEAGDNGVIQGCGPMGLWVIQALSGNLLNSLVAVDIDDGRLELAKKYGATHTINSKNENIKDRLSEITAGRMADWLIEGTGIPALLNSAQSLLRTTGRGKLVLMSSHEAVAKEFDFREAISRSLKIIVAHPAYSQDDMDDFRRAGNFINSGTFQVKELISHRFSLAEIQEAFEALEYKPAGYLKGAVVPFGEMK